MAARRWYGSNQLLILVKVLWLFYAFARQARADDVTTIIDNSDPGIKVIQGEWVHFTGSEYYNKTETLTKDAGASCMYIFNGTGISVFGTQCDPGGSNTTISRYTVDGESASTYTEPPGVKCNQNFVQFYQSPPLSDGQHTLVITNVNSNSWYFLDFLKVVTPAPVSSSSLTSSASIASSTTTSTTSTPRSSKKINGGIIAGIVVVVVVLVALLIIMVFLWRKKKRLSRSYNKTDILESVNDVSQVITPYEVSHSTPTSGNWISQPVTFSNDTNKSSALTTAHNPSLSQASQDESSRTDSSPSTVDLGDSDNRRSMAPTMPPAYEHYGLPHSQSDRGDKM